MGIVGNSQAQKHCCTTYGLTGALYISVSVTNDHSNDSGTTNGSGSGIDSDESARKNWFLSPILHGNPFSLCFCVHCLPHQKWYAPVGGCIRFLHVIVLTLNNNNITISRNVYVQWLRLCGALHPRLLCFCASCVSAHQKGEPTVLPEEGLVLHVKKRGEKRGHVCRDVARGGGGVVV